MLSIIIPVYNTEKTLYRCIDSIINQSYRDWELLLIDDGSTDYSATICDNYTLQDKRIKVFHKSNEGVSAARNVGLKHAKGEWITFVDSDDYVKRDYLKNLLSHTSVTVDLVVSYAEVHDENGFKVERYPSKLVTNENFDTIFIENDMNWHTSPWSKLYKRKIIEENHLRFCKGMHIGEDAVFLFSYMLCSDRIYISHDTDYCYFAYTPGSLTKRVNSLASEILAYDQIRTTVESMILKKAIKNSISLRKLNWLIASYQRRILNALYYNNVQKEERLSVLKTMDFSYYINYMGSSSVKELIFIFLLKYRLFSVYDFTRTSVVYFNKIF